MSTRYMTALVIAISLLLAPAAWAVSPPVLPVPGDPDELIDACRNDTFLQH